jgi:lipoprotein-releasing system ATP-binding protein
MPISPLLRADAICHQGHQGGFSGELRGVSVAIEAGRFTLFSGGPDSGAGLLLKILGLLERPNAGEVWLNGEPTSCLDDAARLALRNHQFGFLFAEPFLLDSFSVAENVAMPLFKISGFGIEQARMRTSEVLNFTGLSADADIIVAELDALDRQKVSLARALAVAPRLLIAEEAGQQLADGGRREFLALLRAIPGALGIAVAGTSPEGVESLNPDREIRLAQGAIAFDSHPLPAQEAPARD